MESFDPLRFASRLAAFLSRGGAESGHAPHNHQVATAPSSSSSTTTSSSSSSTPTTPPATPASTSAIIRPGDIEIRASPGSILVEASIRLASKQLWDTADAALLRASVADLSATLGVSILSMRRTDGRVATTTSSSLDERSSNLCASATVDAQSSLASALAALGLIGAAAVAMLFYTRRRLVLTQQMHRETIRQILDAANGVLLAAAAASPSPSARTAAAAATSAASAAAAAASPGAPSRAPVLSPIGRMVEIGRKADEEMRRNAKGDQCAADALSESSETPSATRSCSSDQTAGSAFEQQQQQMTTAAVTTAAVTTAAALAARHPTPEHDVPRPRILTRTKSKEEVLSREGSGSDRGRASALSDACGDTKSTPSSTPASTPATPAVEPTTSSVHPSGATAGALVPALPSLSPALSPAAASPMLHPPAPTMLHAPAPTMLPPAYCAEMAAPSPAGELSVPTQHGDALAAIVAICSKTLSSRKAEAGGYLLGLHLPIRLPGRGYVHREHANASGHRGSHHGSHGKRGSSLSNDTPPGRTPGRTPGRSAAEVTWTRSRVRVGNTGLAEEDGEEAIMTAEPADASSPSRCRLEAGGLTADDMEGDITVIALPTESAPASSHLQPHRPAPPPPPPPPHPPLGRTAASPTRRSMQRGPALLRGRRRPPPLQLPSQQPLGPQSAPSALARAWAPVQLSPRAEPTCLPEPEEGHSHAAAFTAITAFSASAADGIDTDTQQACEARWRKPVGLVDLKPLPPIGSTSHATDDVDS